ncbi:DNA methylase, putative [unidentified eubacterium SCB49]|nr:DNA methylase, putative [unidentified eubacterium SCB49]
MKDYKIQIARHLRQEQTSAETALWEILRNRNFQNLKFRRQHPLKDYIVDFYCNELELVIELDGEYHNEKSQKEKDENRDFHLNVLGYRVLRYPNNVVFNDVKTISKDIATIKNNTTAHFKKTKAKTIADLEIDSEFTPSQQERSGVRENQSLNKKTDIKILSTKKLKPNQRELLLGQGFSLVDYNAIEIEFIDFETPTIIENAIFTSQNGVHAFFDKNSNLEKIKNCFCVGKKAKSLLEQKGLKVIETANYGVDLAQIIVKKYKKESFHLFCGEQRRDEIPNTLNASKINISEVKTYKTTLKPRKFNQKWDGILFFSPSGVESYFKENQDQQLNNKSLLFCIGNTTANAARKYSDHIVIANSTLVESVIAKAVKTLNKNS